MKQSKWKERIENIKVEILKRGKEKGATEIYNHLKTISTRFGKHFDNIITLRKKLEEAMSVVDKFGTDARSIAEL